MKVFAPAKINLALHVTGQRADGYHWIESLVAFADVGDVLTIEPATSDSLMFSGPFGSVLGADPSTNLVLKARDALRCASVSRPCPPVWLHLEKNLPLSSGIGGGSADAAAALKGLNDLWSLGLSPDKLNALALPLGADVPMCLHGCPLVAKGIGEIIEPIDLPPLHMLLVNPGVAVSTPAIFNALATKEDGRLPSISPSREEISPQAAKAGRLADLLAYLENTRNDLQPAAITLQPVIGEVVAALEASGALFARMSGSGATCFGIFASKADRDDALSAIRTAKPGWWIA